MLSASLHDVILTLFDAASRSKLEVLHQAEQALSCYKLDIVQQAIEEFTHNTPLFEAETWLSKTIESTCSRLGLRFDEWHPNCFYFSVDKRVTARVQFTNADIMFSKIAHKELPLLVPLIQQALRLNLQLNQQKQDHLAVEHVLGRHEYAIPLNPRTISLSNLRQQQQAANDQAVNVSIDKQRIMHFFQLTPSETELARLIFEGLSLEDIAQQRAVSKQTIRKQLQSILKKTQCDSQESLLLTLFDLSMTSLSSSLRIPGLRDQS